MVLVTGAGRGIGKAIALAFARSGRNLILVSRTKEEIQSVATKAKTAGAEALPFVADVSNRKQVSAAVSAAVKAFGSIDILVNSAGICGPIGPLAENDIDSWTRTVEINLIGTMLCMHAVLPHMIRARKGLIINLSGGGAVRPRPCFSAYATSKAAVVRLTETVAHELREHNIRINAIAPGPVNTRMLDEIMAAGEKCGDELLQARRQKIQGGTPPERAAELVLFLASPASEGLTGRLISAVWDDWRLLAEQLQKRPDSSMFTLRRIDGRLFSELPQ